MKASDTVAANERTLIARSGLALRKLAGGGGLTIELFPNGSVHAIRCGDIMLNQWLAHPLEGGLNRLYLRRLDGAKIRAVPLIGPGSPSRFGCDDRAARWEGAWDGLAYEVLLRVHADKPVWFWSVSVTNKGTAAGRVDVVIGQDIGLATEGCVRSNEAYTSHYIDHRIEQDPAAGPVILSRQNQPQSNNTFPWLLTACLSGAEAFATDGFQFFGTEYKITGEPAACSVARLPSKKLQYEFAYPALQSKAMSLAAGASARAEFVSWYEPNHAEASSAKDLALVAAARDLQRGLGVNVPTATATSPATLFQAPLLETLDLGDAEVAELFGKDLRFVEKDGAHTLSFFCGADSHVALKAKERAVERPHGHILRTGQGLLPEDDVMSSTGYAFGVFMSQVTIGNTSFNKLLSVCRSHLNIIRTAGQRIWIQDGVAWKMLGVPSAFEMRPGLCRWLYKTGDALFEVKATASTHAAALRFDINVLRGSPRAWLISYDLVLGSSELDAPCHMVVDEPGARIQFRPPQDSFTSKHVPDLAFQIGSADPAAIDAIGGAEGLNVVPEYRDLPLAVIRTKPVKSLTLRVRGSLSSGAGAFPEKEPGAGPCKCAEEGTGFLQKTTCAVRFEGNASSGMKRLQEILPWFTHDALIHCTVPHGLEQYGGAAWGTRDVCQGPVEFMLTFGHYAQVRRILEMVYAQQYDGTAEWPQWFMFDQYREVQFDHCHGDVIFWPLKSLCEYIEASNDFSVLDAQVPWTQLKGFAPTKETASLFEHTVKQVARIRQMFIGDTALVSYGDGDWDDTLQPADSKLRKRMASGWTVELCYQVLARYADICQRAGKAEFANQLVALATRVREDFNKHIVRRDIVSGFILFEDDGSVRPLLHPEDKVTGIQYRLLPMTRGIISEIFTPEQAKKHLQLIEEHLLFPDGARLMSRAAVYHDGLSKLFKRAETSAYFGREVSLQYVHAHIRYCEALAKVGRGSELVHALLAVNPVMLQDTVKSAVTRQSNTYFSSSDGELADRYEAFARYDEIRQGKVKVKGGWRIYSSGPGIYIKQLIGAFLGIRESFGHVVLDPVLDKSLDGLVVSMNFRGRPVQFRYHVKGSGFGPSKIEANGKPLAFTRTANPYREGGAEIAAKDFDAIVPAGATVDVTV